MTQIPNKVISSMPFEELNSYGAWHKVSSEQYYLVAKNPSEQLRLDVQKLFPICREKKACLGTRLHRWRPKAAFFDMDSTLVREETLDEIAHAYGVLDKVKNITELAMAGKMDFKESLTQRLATLKGCPLSTVKKVIQSITYNQNVKLTIRNLQQSQIPCYLVSVR